ncbi:hypothetical protein Tco_0261176 [Tanacetum coccineum]
MEGFHIDENENQNPPNMLGGINNDHHFTKFEANTLYLIPFPHDTVISSNLNINSSDESPELSLADNHLVQNEPDDFEPAENQNDASQPKNITCKDNPINEADPLPTIISPSTDVNLDTPDPQDMV